MKEYNIEDLMKLQHADLQVIQNEYNFTTDTQTMEQLSEMDAVTAQNYVYSINRLKLLSSRNLSDIEQSLDEPARKIFKVMLAGIHNSY